MEDSLPIIGPGGTEDFLMLHGVPLGSGWFLVWWPLVPSALIFLDLSAAGWETLIESFWWVGIVLFCVFFWQFFIKAPEAYEHMASRKRWWWETEEESSKERWEKEAADNWAPFPPSHLPYWLKSSRSSKLNQLCLLLENCWQSEDSFLSGMCGQSALLQLVAWVLAPSCSWLSSGLGC